LPPRRGRSKGRSLALASPARYFYKLDHEWKRGGSLNQRQGGKRAEETQGKWGCNRITEGSQPDTNISCESERIVSKMREEEKKMMFGFTEPRDQSSASTIGKTAKRPQSRVSVISKVNPGGKREGHYLGKLRLRESIDLLGSLNYRTIVCLTPFSERKDEWR